MQFLIAALFVYRLSRMVAEEEGPFKLFTWLRSLAPESTWVQRGMECIMCLSVWVALPVAYWLGGDWVLTWLALSAVAVIVKKWENKR